MLRKGSITDEIARGATSAEISPGADELSLRRAIEMAGGAGKSGTALDTTIEDGGLPFAAEALEEESQLKTAEKLALTAVFDGRVSLTMPTSAFSNAMGIRKIAKFMDDKSLLLECPLEGNLFDLTVAQAENLLLIDKKSDALPPK